MGLALRIDVYKRQRLGHRPLSGVHEQDDAVDHLEYALDLAAEVGVARGVDDVDFIILVNYRDVLREDRDTCLLYTSHRRFGVLPTTYFPGKVFPPP